MATIIQMRRGTAAVWAEVNPVLAAGEIGVETDTLKIKIGDGVTAWNSVAYYMGATGPTGATGATGPAGPTGATGPAGPGADPSGWISVTETTFTRSNDNLLNVVTGAASRWEKCDKIKFTQHGVTKYGYVHLVTDTTIGFYAGSANVVENTTTYPITNIFLSRAEKPFGFPNSFAYVAGFGGFSVNPSNVVHMFYIVNGICYLDIYEDTNGTSNSSSFNITLPLQAKNVVGMKWSAPAFIYDNGTSSTTPGFALIVANSSSMSIYTNYAGATFTPSGGKRCASVHISYPV